MNAGMTENDLLPTREWREGLLLSQGGRDEFLGR
jgi:hypothetical protein